MNANNPVLYNQGDINWQPLPMLSTDYEDEEGLMLFELMHAMRQSGILSFTKPAGVPFELLVETIITSADFASERGTPYHRNRYEKILSKTFYPIN